MVSEVPHFALCGTGCESLSEDVEIWVVEHCRETLRLVLAYKIVVFIKCLTNKVDSIQLICQLFPKGLLNLWNCVNSKSIKAEYLLLIYNPFLKSLPYPRIVLVEIWKSGQTAVRVSVHVVVCEINVLDIAI